MCGVGVRSNTSRESEVMIGRIITASTMPAVKIVPRTFGATLPGASTVKGADGAITYVEGAFAKDGLTPALIDSGSGGVELSATAVAKSLDAAKFLKDGTNDLALDLNGIYSSNVAGAYPLLLVTYEIVCSKYSDAQVSQAVKAFLTVAATDGQAPLSAKGYVPLAQSLQTKVLAAIKAIS